MKRKDVDESLANTLDSEFLSIFFIYYYLIIFFIINIYKNILLLFIKRCG